MQPIYPGGHQSVWVPVMPPTNTGNMDAPASLRTTCHDALQPFAVGAQYPTSSTLRFHRAMMQPQHQTSQNGVPASRNRTMAPGMSPALSQAPIYPTSPMMMHAHPHAPVMQHPTSHGYVPMPAGRGQPRVDNTHHIAQQQHPMPSSMPYPPPPQAPFARSGW
ncbi:hypothetical protein NMY22_g33 [Coprinellus aureogranulatus]|nr:hypothetical protein NMY22_g33 [Coprinellus aureogranulatus]